MEKKKWRDVVGFEGIYIVSSSGDIFSVKTQKIRKHQINRDGYAYVVLCSNGERTGKTVGRIVAEAFLSNPTNAEDVTFLDGDRTNADISNLRWQTTTDTVNAGAKERGKIAQLHYFSQDDVGESIEKRRKKAVESRSCKVKNIRTGETYGSLCAAGKALHMDHHTVKRRIDFPDRYDDVKLAVVD